MSELAQALAIAAFIVLVGLEWALDRARARRRGRPSSYPLHDSLTNLSIGLGSVLFSGVAILQGVTVHRYLDEHAALVSPVSLARGSVLGSIAVWIAVTIAVDLCFYVSHRAMHRVNLFWTVHAPHHQSEHFNLLVALRVGWFSVFASWIFYLPLALVGVTLEMTLIARGVSSLYQFALHTPLVGRLGVLESVLNTPSHHRVHHGVNARYLDKNYGGILIVWDRLFGTFEPERDDEAPVYGTSRPLASFNPIWSNVVEWVRLGRLTRASRRWRDKLQLWLRPPEWRPGVMRGDAGAAVAAAAAPAAVRRVYDVSPPRPIDAYVAVNAAGVLGIALLSMIFTTRITAAASVLLAAELLAALTVCGALIERRRWGWWLEWTRLGSLAVVAIAWGAPLGASSGPGPLAAAVLLAAVAGLAAWAAGFATRRRRPAAAACSGLARMSGQVGDLTSSSGRGGVPRGKRRSRGA